MKYQFILHDKNIWKNIQALNLCTLIYFFEPFYIYQFSMGFIIIYCYTGFTIINTNLYLRISKPTPFTRINTNKKM